MTFYALLIAAAAAGVLIPKLATASLLPSGSSALNRWTRLLPTATLGAFTALEATAWLGGRSQPGLVVGLLAVMVVLAAVLRRTLLMLVLGAAAVVGLKAAGLL